MIFKKKDSMSQTQALFLNREIGMLEFNRRVLAQAEDADTPSARTPALSVHRQQQPGRIFRDSRRRAEGDRSASTSSAGPDGMNPRDVFVAVSAHAHELVERQYQLLNEEILPALEKAGIALPAPQRLERSAARLDPRLFLQRDDAGAHADRPRSGASVPARAQQEPEFRRGAGRHAMPSAATRAPPSCRRRASCRA